MDVTVLILTNGNLACSFAIAILIGCNVCKIKNLFAFFVYFIFLSFLYGQALPSAVVKAPFPIRSLTWSPDGSVFAFIENDTIFVRNAHTYDLIASIPFPEALSVFLYQETADEVQLVGGAKNGTIVVWSITVQDSIPTSSTTDALEHKNYTVNFANSLSQEKDIHALAISENSNYIAVAFDDFSVGIHFKLRFTHQLISKEMETLDSEIYHLTFSADNSLLATASKDDIIRIWETQNGKQVGQLNFDSEFEPSVFFVRGSKDVVCSTNPMRISVLNFEGEELLPVHTTSPIRLLRPFSRQTNIAVLTDNNNIELYSLQDGTNMGFLAPLNVTPITDFIMSPDDSYVLVGHEDGSLYKISLDEMLAPGTIPPTLRMVAADEVVIKGSEHQDMMSGEQGELQEDELAEEVLAEEEAEEETEEEPKEDGAKPDESEVFPEPMQAVNLLVGTSMLPSPHVISLDITGGYLNSKWLHPFCVGAEFTWAFGWPQKNFPYTYTLSGAPLNPPKFITFELDFPVGIIFTPFKINRDIELYAGLSVGVGLHYLWNGKFGSESITGKLYPAFVGSIVVGAGWKGITLRVYGDYNTQVGFLFSVNLGYTLQLPPKFGGKK